jgi:hypothetical protein
MQALTLGKLFIALKKQENTIKYVPYKIYNYYWKYFSVDYREYVRDYNEIFFLGEN